MKEIHSGLVRCPNCGDMQFLERYTLDKQTGNVDKACVKCWSPMKPVEGRTVVRKNELP